MGEERIEKWQCQSYEWGLIVLMFTSLVFGVNDQPFRESLSHSGLNDLL